MKFSRFFLPDPETHKKAHLISWQGIAVYIILFVLLQSGLKIYNKYNPGILGVNSRVDQKLLVELTNKEREKKGLPKLFENEKLNSAAKLKGENMFEENYWAHYSPSGKDPWGFFTKTEYRFVYAGENLARNFYTSEEVVKAWMASPTHRDNILNSRYKEIGIAVLEGNLKGERTVLVVQEFGTPIEALAESLPQKINEAVSGSSIKVFGDRELMETKFLGSQKENRRIVDPIVIVKSFGFLVVSTILILLILDIYILRRRAVVRISSRHLPHMAMLDVVATALSSMNPGSIL